MLGKENLYKIIDLFASEYGWKIDYTVKLPSDVVDGLVSAIKERRFDEQKVWTKLISLGAACGFSGKLDSLDKLFSGSTGEKESIDEVTWKAQVKGLWLRTRLKNRKNITKEERKVLIDEFELKWRQDKNIEF